MRRQQGRERARQRVPYGAQAADRRCRRSWPSGQKLAEWDPYTLPIITEKRRYGASWNSSTSIENVSTLVEVAMDDVTGLSFKEVVEYKAPGSRAVQICKPADPDPARREEQRRQARERDSRRSTSSPPTHDSLDRQRRRPLHAGDVHGPPTSRVVQDPRHHGRPAARGGTVRGAPSRRTTRSSARRRWPRGIRQGLQGQAPHPGACPRRPAIEQPARASNTWCPKGKHVSVQEGDYVKRGDPLVDGQRACRTTSCACMGVEKLADVPGRARSRRSIGSRA